MPDAVGLVGVALGVYPFKQGQNGSAVRGSKVFFERIDKRGEHCQLPIGKVGGVALCVDARFAQRRDGSEHVDNDLSDGEPCSFRVTSAESQVVSNRGEEHACKHPARLHGAA